MRHLHCKLPQGLWELLDKHAQATHEPIGHILAQALAGYFDVAHHTLYQVSTSGALVEGVYQGAVRVAKLRQHGDLGLGTFEDLDGEMIVLDGRFYQAKNDGSVHEASDDALSPFAVVTRFAPERACNLAAAPSLHALTAQFDRLRGSDNIFFALRVDGQFISVRTRAVSRSHDGVPLVDATAQQPEFEYCQIAGTLVGFWTPAYARSLNVPGYHLHFISADRTKGGHLLAMSASHLRLQIQSAGDYHVALPETASFLHADLTRDTSGDLARAENAKE